jgi:DNA-binding XRE family transcriptional regulator
MARKKYSKIGKRFRALREELDTHEKDCTQDMLSKLIHIQKPQISTLESGERLPSIGELQAYNKHFDVPMEYLLGVKDNRHYTNVAIGSELGLSDKTINTLKEWKDYYKDNSLVFLLNYIFETDLDHAFFSDLYRYVYCDAGKFSMEGKDKKIKKEVACTSDTVRVISKNKRTHTVISLDDIDYIHERSLMAVIKRFREVVIDEMKLEDKNESVGYTMAIRGRKGKEDG